MKDIVEVFARIEDRLTRIEEAVCQQSRPMFHKEWFTVAEVAEIVGKAPFTVREWARLGRIVALKQPSGRGLSSEWTVSRQEIERYLNKGLLPRDI